MVCEHHIVPHYRERNLQFLQNPQNHTIKATVVAHIEDVDVVFTDQVCNSSFQLNSQTLWSIRVSAKPTNNPHQISPHNFFKKYLNKILNIYFILFYI